MAKRQEVMFVLDLSGAYGRGILRGAGKYARRHSRWSISVVPVWNMESIHNHPNVALIIQASQAELGRQLLAQKRVAINVADNQADHPLPTVMSDNHEIGRRVAEHLTARGFQHLAYCGERGQLYAEQRCEGFRQRAAAAGCTVDVRWYEGANPGAWNDATRRWLSSLPKPVGLMACNDVWARSMVEMGLDCGARVPEDLAVVGVDNDDLVCEICDVPISSVAIAAERIGFQAAALLADALEGKPLAPGPVKIPPMGVITRQSSDILAIRDQQVARSVQFIREHASEPITVDDVVKQLRISRRRFEQRFQTALGRSPASEIRRARIERARHLLEATDIPLAQIARDCGFADAPRLSKVFRREMGMTPSQYRMRARLH
jgi:LacI family transcriptional regulator